MGLSPPELTASGSQQAQRTSRILWLWDVYPKVAMGCHGKWWVSQSWEGLFSDPFRNIHPSWNRAIGTVDCFEFDTAIDLWQQHQQRDFSITQCFTCVRMCMHACMLLYIHVMKYHAMKYIQIGKTLTSTWNRQYPQIAPHPRKNDPLQHFFGGDTWDQLLHAGLAPTTTDPMMSCPVLMSSPRVNQAKWPPKTAMMFPCRCPFTRGFPWIYHCHVWIQMISGG